VDSGGGRDDASRRAHLDKLWRMGMEVSRNDIDRALLASGLTRADMDGLDRDIYESIKVCWMCAVRCALCPVPCALGLFSGVLCQSFFRVLHIFCGHHWYGLYTLLRSTCSSVACTTLTRDPGDGGDTENHGGLPRPWERPEGP
jgi:hypothetical protein